MSKKKEILFVHQNFPAQYLHLAPAMSKKNHINASSLSLNDLKSSGVKHHKYTIEATSTPKINRLATEFETKMIRAEAAALKCFELKEGGYSPDLIIGHPGWGETFLLKEVWPNTKLLSYFEFYYNTKDSDVDFDLQEQVRPVLGFDLCSKLAARNSPFLSIFNLSEMMVCPTKFQKDTAPEEYKKLIKVVHDGIDTEKLRPMDKAFVELSNKNINNLSSKKIRLTKEDKIITFVNRNLEPYRGYHKFMRALPEIVEKNPDAYILIVGEDGVSYGASPPKGQTYKDIYYNEVKDSLPKGGGKILFLGRVEYRTLLALFAITTVHVYLTYPFVLSWSMLEAMSMGALVLGSKTAPVEEIIKHDKNGILVDFFDTKALAKNVNNILENPGDYEKLKSEGRKTIIDNYDLNNICLPQQMKIIENLL